MATKHKDLRILGKAVRKLMGTSGGWMLADENIRITDTSLTMPTEQQIEAEYAKQEAIWKKEQLRSSLDRHIHSVYPLHEHTRDLQKHGLYQSFLTEAGFSAAETVRSALGTNKHLVENIGKTVNLDSAATTAVGSIAPEKLSKFPGKNKAQRTKKAKKMVKKIIEVNWKNAWIEACHVALDEAIENDRTQATFPPLPAALKSSE